jgi:hypothetical protein
MRRHGPGRASRVPGVPGGERLAAKDLACALGAVSPSQQARLPSARSPILNVFWLLEASVMPYTHQTPIRGETIWRRRSRKRVSALAEPRRITRNDPGNRRPFLRLRSSRRSKWPGRPKTWVMLCSPTSFRTERADFTLRRRITRVPQAFRVGTRRCNSLQQAALS